jgi:drug/metabolite transporter (DMT)-like permease
MILVTLSLWGVLPIILKLGLNYYSVGTIAWFRFFFSFVVLFWFLFIFRSGCRLLLHPPMIGILGGAALAVNYFGMTQGIHLSELLMLQLLSKLPPFFWLLLESFSSRKLLD